MSNITFNLNDVLQIAQMVASSIYLVLLGVLSYGMRDKRLMFWHLINPCGEVLLEEGNYARLNLGKPGSRVPGVREIANDTEVNLTRFLIILVLTINGLFWGSIGTNLTNGVPNGYTNPVYTTQLLYAFGTILFILVWIFTLISFLAHGGWGWLKCKKCW